MVVPDRPRLARWGPGLLLVPLVVVLVGVHAGTPDRGPARFGDGFWRSGVPVAIAVHEGQARFRFPSSAQGTESLVIVSSLSRSAGPFPIRLEAIPVADAGVPEQAHAPTDRPPRLRWHKPEPIKEPVRGMPPRQRNFSLMVRDGDVASASNYLAVRGILRAVGKRVQVYVAAEDLGRVDPELLKDLVTTFDDRIVPVTARSVGLASDIDGDGRFTVLLSSWLNRLGNGRHALDGFVRVTDLDPVFPAPFGNHCDMMYLSTGMRPGPHLRTVLAHEYMHAVVFSRKSRELASVRRIALEEEGWLDEALAHLAEDLHGFSRSNIDYRVSAFLSRPESYQLVVEDYYAADLFRSHGNRGSTYLFLRWCVDQYGPELLPTLIESRLRGVANLEEATGCSFTELYRRWSVALFLSGLDPAAAEPARGVYRSLDMRAPIEDWELAGPRATRVFPAGPAECWSATGTSSRFLLVQGSPPSAVEVTITGPPDAELQVTAVPLPAGMARLELEARSSAGADGDLRLRASIRERRGELVRLTALAWEPLVPPADPHMPGFRRGQLDMLGIASSFGTSALSAGGTLQSRSIRLKNVHREAGPLVVKLIGTDARGHRVSAWAEINRKPSENGAEDHGPLAESVR